MKLYGSRILAVGAFVVGVFGTYHAASPAHHGSHVVVAPGQPAPRVGPSYLYPDPALTPGVPNPQVTHEAASDQLRPTALPDGIASTRSNDANARRQTAPTHR